MYIAFLRPAHWQCDLLKFQNLEVLYGDFDRGDPGTDRALRSAYLTSAQRPPIPPPFTLPSSQRRGEREWWRAPYPLRPAAFQHARFFRLTHLQGQRTPFPVSAYQRSRRQLLKKREGGGKKKSPPSQWAQQTRRGCGNTQQRENTRCEIIYTQKGEAQAPTWKGDKK